MDLGMCSIVGRMRKIDEDSVMALSLETYSDRGLTGVCLCALADGMGGGARGDVASKVALDTFWDSMKQLVLGGVSDASRIKKEIIKSVSDANTAVNDYRRKNKIEEMGTTITAAYICGENMHVANVGDSRTYVINGGKVQKKTKDHSYVQELVDAGRITPEQVRTHPNRNEITRVVGIDKNVEIDYYEWRVFNGDSILLCCDGLWEGLGDDLVAQFASRNEPAVNLVREMVDEANQLDGSDNISAILFRPSLQLSSESVLERKTELRSKPGDT
jgi:serine/threonine protein phosphatase PrpC